MRIRDMRNLTWAPAQARAPSQLRVEQSRDHRGPEDNLMSLTIASVSLGNTIRDVVIAGSMMLALLLTIQAAYALYLMIYTWDQPDARKMAQAPRRFRTPPRSRSP